MSELVDTNIIIMYGKRLFTVLSNRNVAISSTVIFEYLNYAKRQYDEFLKKGDFERALGFLGTAREIINQISKGAYPLLHPTASNFLESIDIAENRNVDIGDALLASIAKSNNIRRVISNDEDWNRLSDYVGVEKLT